MVNIGYSHTKNIASFLVGTFTCDTPYDSSISIWDSFLKSFSEDLITGPCKIKGLFFKYSSKNS